MQDHVYRPQLPLLAKLMFLSSAIHQTIFMLLSSLPFAIGQVQRLVHQHQHYPLKGMCKAPACMWGLALY